MIISLNLLARLMCWYYHVKLHVVHKFRKSSIRFAITCLLEKEISLFWIYEHLQQIYIYV